VGWLVIALMLRSHGWEPVMFDNASAALQYLVSAEIDLNLRDFQMPDIDCRAAKPALRKMANPAVGEVSSCMSLFYSEIFQS